MAELIDSKVFLATTANEDFWDKKAQSILFLGEWCKINGKDFSNTQTISFLRDNAVESNKEAQKCWDIYESTLNYMIDYLNDTHGVSKSKRYWELILGDWLYTYIQVVQDRYTTLKAFKDEYAEFDTILLSPDSYITPLEYVDFVTKVSDDEYNLQLYSQILTFMGYKFESKNYDIGQKHEFSYSKKNITKNLFLKILNLFTKKPIVTMTSPYFSGGISSYVKLVWNSKGSIVFDDFNKIFSVKMQINQNIRKKLINLYDGEDDFKKLLFYLLPQNLPLLFIEGFEQIKLVALNRGKPKSSIYSTANALHSNYIYKLWIAEYIENIKLVCIQHGGGYGVDSLNSPEKYERKVVDRYLTWGWKEDEITVPLTHEKICQKIHSNKSGYILFIQTMTPRYIIRLQNSYNSSAFTLAYIPKALSFFENVGDVKRFFFRGSPRDNGFDVVAQITARFPSMIVDNHSISFYKRLQGARLLICDHMHTTYLESLAMNFPTVIFIEKSYYSFRRPEIIQLLINAKILFYSEIEAAQHINKIYDNIDEWWLSPEVQKAREEFCYNYARPSENWAADWVKEFNSIIKEKI